MKKFSLLGLLLITAGVIIMGNLTGCDNGTTSTVKSKFEGRWKYTDLPADYGQIYLVFSGDTFSIEVSGQISQSVKEYSATFTYTETEMTFITTSNTWKQSYTLSGNNVLPTLNLPNLKMSYKV